MGQDTTDAPVTTAGGGERLAARLFAGPGEMRARGRALDWAATPLGPVEGWPQSLRTAVSVCLASGFPKLVMWGPELVQIYNDAFRSVLQAKHPAGLGQRARDCWPELWETIGPMYRGVLETGESVFLEDQLFTPERRGYVEEAYFTFSYSAIPDEAHRPAGILATVFETTRHVESRGERERALERANAELRAAAAERERLLVETERARAEADAARVAAERTAAALAGSEARFRTVQEALPHGLVLLRPERDRAPDGGAAESGRVVDFRIQYANGAGARLTGQRPDEMVGHTLLELFPTTRDLGLFDAYVRVLETGEPWEDDVRYVADGLAAGYRVAAVRVGGGADAELALLYANATARLAAEGERARLHAELAAERERLRSVILHAPAPLALLEGPEHRFALVNAAYRRISGGGRDVTGLTPPEAFPELAGSGIYELFDRVYETGEAWDGPESLVRYDRDGTGVQDTWFNLRLEPLRDGAGRVTAILNFAVDVTEQVRARREVERLLAESERAAAALAESERRFRTVQDASPLGFAIHRPVREGGRADGRVVDFTLPYVNEAGARIVGHPREHLLAGTVLGIWPGTEPEGVFAGYVRVLETGEPWYREILYERDRLAAGLTLTVVRIGEGANAEIGITFTDVTARLRAEAERDRLFAALGAERERLRAVILSMPSPLALHVGPEHRFELVNDAFRRISGGGRDDTGLTVREAFPELAGQGVIEALDRVWATGAPWVASELPIRYDRDGTGLQDTWYNVRYEPVRDPNGAVSGVLNFAVDVTPQVRARQEVERLLAESERARVDAEAARAEAQAANQAKGEFLAVMSHELRTPLNAIGGYAELMELGIHGPVTDAQRTALARIQSSQRHLLGLIAGVLDYSRVEAGAVTYRLADVPVAEAVAEAETLVAPQLRAKGLGYGWSGAPPGLAVRADREKLQQILLNLLGNAIKFTHPRDGVPGRIEVACSAAEGGDGEPADGRVRIQVRDTGEGIAPDELERVFEPFVQADQRLTRAHAGVGLGLAISRDLARGMGGDLTAESEVGVGSTFTLTLPTAP